MKNTSRLLAGVHIPRFFQARQIFPTEHIAPEDIPVIVHQELDKPGIREQFKPGMRIAITAGSRGLSQYVLILRSIVAYCKERGTDPFVIPAMGSHGGADAEGQRKILEGYGITEASIHCPIISSMETALIGKTETGRDVYIDKHAAEADGIIVFNRVKPHTCFEGPVQSGLMKMMAIGLAKQYGAQHCHERGYAVLGDSIIEYGRGILQNANVLLGFATIENAYDEVHSLTAVRPEAIFDVESELQPISRRLMPRILVDECDVLVVDEVGKNFSGDGMDPNITGTFCTPYAHGGIRSQRVCVLDLSPETHGNGMGVGMAQCTTRRCFEKLDLDEMYPNAITSVEVGSTRIPPIMENDREAIQFAIRTLENVTEENARIVRIPNSQFIQHILLSEHYYEQVKARDDMEIESDLFELPFDENGNLTIPRIRS